MGAPQSHGFQVVDNQHMVDHTGSMHQGSVVDGSVHGSVVDGGVHQGSVIMQHSNAPSTHGDVMQHVPPGRGLSIDDAPQPMTTFDHKYSQHQPAFNGQTREQRDWSAPMTHPQAQQVSLPPVQERAMNEQMSLP